MNNILLIGNGFDLAHGLPTSYNDFLFILKNWNDFYINFQNAKKGKPIGEENRFYKYLVAADAMEEQNIKRLGEIIKRNSWVQYYCNCEAEIDGWIDFEREIYPVIDLIETVFNTVYDTVRQGNSIDTAHIAKGQLNSEILRIMSLWGIYFDTAAGASVSVKVPYVSKQYGILKKQIIKSLRENFDEFIMALELYLHEFAHKRTGLELLNKIKSLEIGNVISFNYTHTEELYGVKEENVHHIHGMLREDLASGGNNMVVGVNEQENQNMDFIYFVKYFQRIQKGSGVRYKEFIDKFHKDNIGQTKREDYTLYIHGHSLDETDADILKYVIGDYDNEGQFKMKPQKVVVFYYNNSDYEQKVINLIKLYGRSTVEKYMEKRLFDFQST